MRDVIAEKGSLFLGSRLKRLADQFQASAGKILERSGLKIQPAHQAIMVALESERLTVGQLAQAVGSSQPGVTRAIGQLTDLGLVTTTRGEDQRERLLSLTAEGQKVLEHARSTVWPAVQTSVDALCEGLSGALLDQLAELESRLKALPFDARVENARKPALRIVDYDDRYAHLFAELNAEWINEMFVLEDADRVVLNNPRERIIERGGTILFVEADGIGIVGTGAFQPAADGSFELIKMAVRPSARGSGAGRRLLKALIDRARERGISDLWLLSNSKCTAAIHLYESVGFTHDKEVMKQHGSEYERCNVAMRYTGWDREPGLTEL